MNTTAQPAPTDKQLAFVKVLAEKVGQQRYESVLLDQFSVVSAEDLGRRDVSSLIDSLKSAADAGRSAERQQKNERRVVQEAVAAASGLDAGMYSRNGTPFRVYPARNGGHLLAQSMIDGKWVYMGAASRFVTADMKMSLEEAREYGLQTGVCICCARVLTDPESVERGIGPVCLRKYFGG